jgi:HK97 gp10 family phage protein
MADSSFSIRIDGLDKLQRNFQEAGVNYRPLMTQAMVKATTKIQNTARSQITQHGTTYQGNLGRSITVREASASRGEVAVGERYGGAVEFGRRPGKFPPISALERWAALKLGTPGLGFVIARKIAREGTKAQPYMEPTFRSEADFVLDQFKQATEQIVKMMAA